MKRGLMGFCFLLAVAPATWAQDKKRIGDDYFDKPSGIALASHEGQFYLIGNEKLYRINVEDGSKKRIGSDYFDKPSGVAVVSHDGALYLIGNEKLYRIGK